MFTLILIVVAGIVVAPVITYLVIKFGAAAYFREKQKQNEKDKS
jgi:hypothetical protein